MQKLSSLLCALFVSASGIAWTAPTQAQSIDKSSFPKKAIAQNNQASKQADKQAIIQVYQAMNAAIERKDINQLYSHYAPEYSSIGLDGRSTNLQQQSQEIQKFFQILSKIKARSEFKQIQISGQTATVVGVGYISGILTDPKNPQVYKPISLESTSQDIWKRTSSGWKLTNTHTLSLKNTSTKNASTRPRQQANQTGNSRIYEQAHQEAIILIDSCYHDKNVEDCNKLNKIESTLKSLCSQNDSQACDTYTSVMQYDAQTHTLESITY